MNVVVAIDSFKGSLSSQESGRAITEGIMRVYPDASVTVCPVADGGEGTVDALTSGLGGTKETVTVTGPLGDKVSAAYGIIGQTTAVIEMAEAAGITLVSPEKRNPLYTTTYGVGEMIEDAIRKGCREFIIGIGGSATNDGGIGMLQALGFGFCKENGEPVSRGALGLAELHRITNVNALPALSECTFRIACDVDNPLCGEKGCSAIYGPQKGATPEMIADMDGWLKCYAELAKEVNRDADPDTPGAGAAGGLGFAFMTFLGGKLQKGIELILEATKAEDAIKQADIVITGEGRLDAQTVMGKAPKGVAMLAKKYEIPVIALAGAVTEDAKACNRHGIDAFFPIQRGVCTLEEAMDQTNAYRNMADTVEQIFRLIQITK